MFMRIRSGWGLTKKSWHVIRSQPALAKLPLTGGGVGLIVFLVLGVPGVLLLEAEGTAPTIGGIVLLALSWYLAAIVVVYYNVALAASANQALEGVAPDVKAAKRTARSRSGSIAGWALISVFVSILLGAIGEKGTLGRVGASIGAAVWSLVTFLVVPVLALESVGPIASMKRAATLIRQRWGEQITGDIVIGGAAGIVALIGFLIGVGGVVLLAESGTTAAVAGVLILLVGIIITIAAAVFGGATRGVFGVALYHYVAQDQALPPFTAAELAIAHTRKPLTT